MATRVSDLVERARCLYNDPKSDRFSDVKILTFVNEAISEVAGLRPSEFVEVISVPLTEGALQTVPDGYCYIEVDGVSPSGDAGAAPTTTVGKRLDTVMAERFGGVSCADSGGGPEDYAPQSATGVSFSPKAFKVSPPAPEGVETSVDVVVSNANPPTVLGSDCSPLPAPYDAQILDFVLHRMHAIQVESAFHVAQSQRYCDKFYAALNADYQSASRIKSGYNYGATGEGNANLGAQRDLRGTAL